MPSKVKPVPVTLYPLKDLPLVNDVEPFTSGWASGLPIAIDLGTYQTRAGYCNEVTPGHVFYSQIARYRDRKANKTFTLVGNDMCLDSNAKQNLKSPFDGNIITSWETVETILDYTFAKMSVQSHECVDNPILMSELIGCPRNQRKTMNEILFEGYRVPSVVFGIDSLFAYKYNGGQNGLVVSSGNEATHLIPVVDGDPILSLCKRINAGGRQLAMFMQNLLSLKYPLFPMKLSLTQSSALIQDHCYISTDYTNEINSFLDFDGLEKRERIIQAPYTEVVKEEKSEEELARIAEKRKESGRRLQEQVAKQRLEKLIQKENDLQYYKNLQERVDNAFKKDVKRLLEKEGFKDEGQLQKTIKDLTKAIKRARKQDVGDDDMEEVPSFPLLEVPDDELDDEQIKEKRRQRLMKANYDARMKAKQEKLEEKQRLEEEARKDQEWRDRDLDGWITDRKQKLSGLLEQSRDRKRMKDELSNRKSHASQMRMKSIAALASDARGSKRRKVKGDDDPDDTFGANDDDWSVYRSITNASEEEEEEEEKKSIQQLQEQLQAHDPNFSLEEMSHENVLEWNNSLVHMFLRGPHEFDPESQAQLHQFCLNIERIRVPEILFQPSIAGIDQAGIVETAEDILLHRLGQTVNPSVTQDIFLTGGQAHFQNFDERLRRDLRSVLPVGTPLKIRRANDPQLDAWKGMAQWATTPDFKKYSVTRQEYEEMGGEYLKEHVYGNAYY